MYKPYYLKDVLDQSNKKLFTHISTFSGGGGSTIGIKLAGGNTLVANEFVEEAVSTYKDNFNTPVILGDIKDLTGQDFLDKAGIKKGELDLLEGSPPCSAFSLCGAVVQNKKKEDKPVSLFDDDTDDYFDTCDIQTVDEKMGWNKTKKYSDGKTVENIEDLFFEYIRIANDIQPKVIIAENVVGLTAGESKKYLNKILNEFEKIGYLVTHHIMNSSDYGVAQNRRRVIFLAIRDDIAEQKGINQFNIAHIYPEPFSDETPIKSVIGDIDEEYQHGEESWMNKLTNTNYFKGFSPLIDKIIIKQQTEKDKAYLLCDVLEKRKYFNYYVLSNNKPSPTLTQKGLQNGCFILPDSKRPLSIQEAIRIMGLPEDYNLTGNSNQKYERLGRMVSPPIYQHLCKSIYEKVLHNG